MAKFIKLSSGQIVNADRIAVIVDRSSAAGGSKGLGSKLRFEQGFIFYANETPEQILALIEAKGGSQ